MSLKRSATREERSSSDSLKATENNAPITQTRDYGEKRAGLITSLGLHYAECFRIMKESFQGTDAFE